MESLPAIIESLQWVGSRVVIGLVGVVVGLLLEGLLPDSVQNQFLYWGGRLRKWIKDDEYRIELAVKYRFSDPMESEDFDEQLARELGVRSDDNGKFLYDKDSSGLDLDIEITPQFDNSIGHQGNAEVSSKMVGSITVQIRCKPNYRNLTSCLLDIQDIERNLLETIVSLGGERDSSVVKCEMPAKPTLQRLLGKGDIDTLRGNTSEGTRIDVSSEEIQIHADPDTALTSIIRRTIVHYA